MSIGAVHRSVDTVADLDAVRECGLALCTLTPGEPAIDIAEMVWPERAALLLGAEGPGLKRGVTRRPTSRVRIPMHAGADSLNLGTAAAIAFAAASGVSRPTSRS